MSPISLSFSPRGSTLTKRIGFLLFFTVAVLYLLPSNPVHSVWTARASTYLAKEYKNALDLKLNNTQWGLMAQQVNKMTAWANEVPDKLSEIRGEALTKTLSALYPFLQGADNLYVPWDKKRIEMHQSNPAVGIVMCVGSKNYHLAAHLIASLRKVHRSVLPIEVAYAGDDDLQPHHRQFLNDIDTNIDFVDLFQVMPGARNDLEKAGWAMKPFAMLASKFRQTVLVDADDIFLLSPDDLFEQHPGLIRTGALFYHDRCATGGDDKGLQFLKDQITLADRNPSNYLQTESLFYTRDSWYEADSGLVALDKSRPEVFMGLVFTTWLNSRNVRDPVTYRMFYGDKETFWIALELTGVDYFFNPWYAGTLGRADNGLPENPDTMTTQICGTHMLHMDHTGTKPFWTNGGMYQHKDKPERGYAALTHWWRGNSDRSNKPRWSWVEGNIACLSQTHVKELDASELDVVASMISVAKEVDEKIRAPSR